MPEPAGRSARPPGLLLLAALIAGHLAVEAVLLGADLGLWGSARLRQVAFEFAGFWPGLLAGWRPNYPGQGLAMFVTYGLVHGGPVHAAVNMATLWSLGGMVLDWAGQRGLLLVYGVALLGGALGYALLARSAQPMVGASGALFGLAGALAVWSFRDEPDRPRAWRLLVWIVAFLLAINLAMFWALDGQIAWQTHLGGGLAGALCALLLDPVRR